MDKEDGFSKNFEAKGAAFEDSSDSPKLKIKKKAKMNSKDYTPKKDIALFLKRSYNIDPPYKLLLLGSFFWYMQNHNIRREDFVTLLDCENVQLFKTRLATILIASSLWNGLLDLIFLYASKNPRNV